MVPIREIAQMADGHRTATDFDVTDWAFPSPHALDEILNMIVALVETHTIFRNRISGYRLRRGPELTSRHKYFAVGSLKRDPTFAAVNHFDAVRIEVSHA